MATSSSLTSTTSSISNTTSTATTKAELFAQYHQALLREFTNNIRENINIRLDAVEQIVNLGLPDNFARFVINANVRNEIMSKIEPEIDDKTKVQHKACTKQINSIKDYKMIARNRLNRNKPKFLGNFVYGEIIFNRLYPHIYEQCTLHKLASKEIMRYFISILITIFENYAQFTQTKPQPIITYNTLVNENLFKSGCINLLKLYQIPADKYETDKKKRKSKKNEDKTSTKKPKEPAKRDKAKMAFQRIVDAMKLINTEEKLSFVDVPQCIITGHDTRKNKTYQTMCITPPCFPETQCIGINNEPDSRFFPLNQGQYLPANVPVMPSFPSTTSIPAMPHGVPVISQNNVSFGSCSSNMINTHFGEHPDVPSSNSSSSGDELSASTNSGDRENVSLSDSGTSREYSSSSASNSLSIHIPEHMNNIGYDGNMMNNFGAVHAQNVNVNASNGYNQHQQCPPNEYPVLPASNNNVQRIWMNENENENMNDAFNGYQPQQIQTQQSQFQQQTQDMFYGNNNNGNMVFTDDYKQNIMTPMTSGYNENNNDINMNMVNNYNNQTFNHSTNMNNNFSFNNCGNNGINENIEINGDNQFGSMLSGADFNTNILSNNYDTQTSFQYPQQPQIQAPVMSNSTFHNNNTNNLLLPQTQIHRQQSQHQTPQYGHHNNNYNHVTVNRNNDNNAAIASTNSIFGGFDNNSIANSNVNTFGCFDNTSIAMNNINNLSTNQSTQMPPIINDEIGPNTINSGYGASRGRSRANNVSSLRYSPLALPAPRTQPLTLCNPFSYTPTNNSGDSVHANASNNTMVPFPFGGDRNNNYGY